MTKSDEINELIEVELLPVGGTLCYFLHCRLRLLKVALSTTDIVDFNFEKGPNYYLEGVLNLTLDSSWLGVLDGQLALLADDVHILLTSSRPTHCGRPQLRLLLL